MRFAMWIKNISVYVAIGNLKRLDMSGTVSNHHVSICTSKSKGVDADTTNAFRPRSRTRNYLPAPIC